MTKEHLIALVLSPFVLLIVQALVSKKLLDEQEEEEKKPIETYASEIFRILKPGKFFVIISCNHDKEELEDLFAIKSGFQLLQDFTLVLPIDFRMILFMKPETLPTIVQD